MEKLAKNLKESTELITQFQTSNLQKYKAEKDGELALVANNEVLKNEQSRTAERKFKNPALASRNYCGYSGASSSQRMTIRSICPLHT